MRMLSQSIVCLLLVFPLVAFATTPPAPVPQTGQTISYAAGDDGAIRSGVAWPDPRFTDHGNGTVTDNLTGLMWTKDYKSPGPLVCVPDTNKLWQGALEYAACLNINNYLGYRDWRVPNIRELGTLGDMSQTELALPAGNPFSNIMLNKFWSSTTLATDTAIAFYVDLYSGSIDRDDGYKNGSGAFVWPVRSGQSGEFGTLPIPQTGQTFSYATGDDGALMRGVSWPNPRFVDNVNGTVSDNLTGLTWLRNANCTETVGGIVRTTGVLSWLNALNWSNNLANNYCELTDGSEPGDWHLPNRNEIGSLIDYSNATPALPTGQPFINIKDSYWSSTTFVPANYNYAWFISMDYGYFHPYNKDNDMFFYVLPVRNGQIWNAGTLKFSAITTDFGSVVVNGGSADIEIKIKNRGTSATTINAVTITGTNAADFNIRSGGSSACNSLTPTLMSSSSCTLIVTADFKSSGSKVAALNIIANGSSVSIPLSGTALADNTPPSITGFSIPTTSSSLIVPINFVATDNAKITDYCVSVTNNVSSCSWTTSVPVQYTFTGIPVGTTVSRTLYAFVRDGSGNVSSSSSANVVINLKEAIAPIITVFSVPTPSTALTVPVTLSATDNVGVTGYCLSESTTPDACSWSSTPPAYFTFASTGQKTLYAYAKDAADNIAQSTSAAISISGGMTPSSRYFALSTQCGVPYPSGQTITRASMSVSVPAGCYIDSFNSMLSGASSLSSSITNNVGTFTFNNSPGFTTSNFIKLTVSGSIGGLTSSQVGLSGVSYRDASLVAITGVTTCVRELDLTVPIIQQFAVASSTVGLDVPITSFTAIDDTAISGYYVSTSPAKPSASAQGWSELAPSKFELPIGTPNGSVLFYAFVKDASGNVSNAVSASTTLNTATLTVSITGSGGGTVNSNPSEIACGSGNCNGVFNVGTPVILYATPDQISLFTSWDNNCVVSSGNCNLTMNNDKSVTATFTLAPKAMIGAVGYDSLNYAYSGAAATATMLVLGSEHIENLTMDGGKYITVKGGYKADYLGKGDLPTVLKGVLTIGTGSLTVDGVTIR